MKSTTSFAIACLLDNTSAIKLEPIWLRQQNQEQTFFYGPSHEQIQREEFQDQVNYLEKQHRDMIAFDPDNVYGNERDSGLNNNQYGLAARDLYSIDQSDDGEPDQNIEHIMDDSSQSGSDGEETAEDRANYKASLARAESMAQRRSQKYYDPMEMIQISSKFFPDETDQENQQETKLAVNLLGIEHEQFLKPRTFSNDLNVLNLEQKFIGLAQLRKQKKNQELLSLQNEPLPPNHDPIIVKTVKGDENANVSEYQKEQQAFKDDDKAKEKAREKTDLEKAKEALKWASKDVETAKKAQEEAKKNHAESKSESEAASAAAKSAREEDSKTLESGGAADSSSGDKSDKKQEKSTSEDSDPKAKKTEESGTESSEKAKPSDDKSETAAEDGAPAKKEDDASAKEAPAKQDSSKKATSADGDKPNKANVNSKSAGSSFTQMLEEADWNSKSWDETKKELKIDEVEIQDEKKSRSSSLLYQYNEQEEQEAQEGADDTSAVQLSKLPYVDDVGRRAYHDSHEQYEWYPGDRRVYTDTEERFDFAQQSQPGQALVQASLPDVGTRDFSATHELHAWYPGDRKYYDYEGRFDHAQVSTPSAAQLPDVGTRDFAEPHSAHAWYPGDRRHYDFESKFDHAQKQAVPRY